MTFVIATFATTVTACLFADESERATSYLKHELRLSSPGAGSIWIVTAEHRLQMHLKRLEPLRLRALGLQQRLDREIASAHQIWQQNQELLRRTSEARSKTTNDEEKRKLDARIQRLENESIPPDQLYQQSRLQSPLIDFTNARNELFVLVKDCHRLLAKMKTAYAQLDNNPRVAQALAVLGADHRLGPMHGGYLTEFRQLDDYLQPAITPWVPMFYQSRQDRLGAVLCERIPVVLSWKESSDPTIITAGMATAAGLQVNREQPPVELPVSSSRRVRAYPTKLPTLHVGSCCLRSVDALVLTHQDEDLGGQISADAFPQWNVRRQPERLRISFEKKTVD